MTAMRSCERYQLHHGDCLDAMRAMEPESIHTIITDPPYGLSFMGKDWDGCVPGVAFWLEALRVAKPGAHLLAFGGTRTFHRLTVAIEDAGWEIRDCLSWLYGCLSEDSELLTADGWVPYHKAIEGNHALGYNADANTYEWMPIEEVYVYDYRDTAYHLQSDSTDQIVSRNHRCIVERSGGYAFQYAETLQQQARIPVLENLPSLLRSLPVPDERAGIAKQDLFKGLRGPTGCGGSRAKRTAHYAPRRGVVRGLRQDRQSTQRQARAESNLLVSVQRGSTRSRVGEAWHQRGGGGDSCRESLAKAKDERVEQSGVERRRDGATLARKPRGRNLCSVPGSLFRNGSGGRVCNGAPAGSRASHRSVPVALRGGSPQKPRQQRQPDRKPATVREQQRPQAVRGEGFTRSDLVSVTPVRYEGKVWCIRVRSGAFVARRNGKVFVTGNSGFPKSHNLRGEREGWGTALKPSWEPIIMARKPLRGTVAANVEAFGTGALNIDGCRIGNDGGCHGTERGAPSRNALGDGLNTRGGSPRVEGLGRWPANVLLDEEAAEVLDGQSGVLHAGSHPARRAGMGFHGGAAGTQGEMVRMDSGGASRFFYVAKPDRAERNSGLGGRSTPAVSENATMGDAERADWKARNGNFHPTVKPVDLMRYLCRLVSPPGMTILDPFMGSGTTGVAAIMEGFKFIGCEMNPEYAEIATHRIGAAQAPLGFEEALR